MFFREWNLSGYLQTQEAECGLMCLAVASEVLGRGLSATDIRQWFAISNRGASMAELCDQAGAIGLIPSTVACGAREISALQIPAILHWNDRHYCLFLGKAGARYLIFDPAKGLRKLKFEEVSSGFSGAAIQFANDLSAPLQEQRNSRSLKLLWTLAKAVKGQIVVLLGLSFVLQIASLALPLLSQVAINLGAIQGSLTAISIVAGSMLAVHGLNFVVEVWRGRINHGIASRLSESATRQLFRHMLHLPVEWFERRRVADTVSRFDSVEPVRSAVSSGLATLVVDGVLGLCVATGLFIISPILGSVIILSVGATAVAKTLFAPSVAAQTALAATCKIHEHAKRWETFRAILTVKLASAESAQDRAWSERMNRCLLHTEQAQSLTTYQQSTASLIGSAGSVLVLYVGANMVVDGRISIGGLFAFVMYRRYLADKVAAAVDQISNLWTLKYHLERVSEVFKTPKEKRWNDLREMGEYISTGSISFLNVGFRHSPSDPLILQNVVTKFAGGATHLICGPSGSGKTTLLRLIAGVVSPSFGTIAIDDVPLTNLSPYQIRSAIAAVLQDDEVFAGTIYENIVMFADTPNLDEAIEALRSAELWKDVKMMPLGIHTPVGESGRLISAGQRQRILLARAFYRNPKIFLLDEATANLDPEIEGRIMSRIKAHPATKILVSHSLQLSRLADRSFVLDERGFRELGRRVEFAEAV